MIRIAGFVIGGLCIAAVLALAGFLWSIRGIPAETLEARYSYPDSRFIVVDGARLHVVDEGPRDAPVIMAIHSHYIDLAMWDGWAETLTDRYRLVRFDMTSHGLSGRDPTDDYSLERSLELMDGLADALGLERFSLAGSSLGGQLAYWYAAKHPERTERLMLFSPAGLVREGQDPMTPRAYPYSTEVTMLSLLGTDAFWGRFFTRLVGDAAEVDPGLAERYKEILRLRGQRDAEMTRVRQYIADDPDTQLRSVTAPTLISWGRQNPQLNWQQVYTFLDLLEQAPTRLIVYDGIGHIPIFEAPYLTAADAADFLETPVEALTPPAQSNTEQRADATSGR